MTDVETASCELLAKNTDTSEPCPLHQLGSAPETWVTLEATAKRGAGHVARLNRFERN